MRVFNFSPGPAALPLEVLEQARDEMLDWNQGGMSVMEVSHRGKAFMEVAAEAEADLRELMGIPRSYKVMFLQGGASAQFAIVPMNLATADSTTDYVNTGHWSNKAIVEARRYVKVHVAADAGGQYLRAPPQSELNLSGDAAYVHYTPNETIGGVEFGYVPQTRGIPLVADIIEHLVSADRCVEVRSHLCRCAKEHRSFRIGGRHRARRPHRQRALRHTAGVRL
jgi:phosphoserine aminotransferase